MNQDTAANVYDFPAREYGIQGRWPSPEHRGPRRADFARWGGGPAGLAAVNPMDPQTWNRYAYVRNSPLEFTDPMGTCKKQVKGVPCGGYGGGGLTEALAGCSWSDDLTDCLSFSITPYIGGYTEFDIANGTCLGECAYIDQVKYGFYPQPNVDPCIYLNDAGTGLDNSAAPVDYNSSPGECNATHGFWLNPGQGFIIGPNAPGLGGIFTLGPYVPPGASANNYLDYAECVGAGWLDQALGSQENSEGFVVANGFVPAGAAILAGPWGLVIGVPSAVGR